MHRRGDYAFTESASRGASDARILWDSQLDPAMVRALAVSCSVDDPDAFDLRALRIPAIIVKDAKGEEVAFGRGRTAVRLSIGTGTLLNGPVRLTYELAGRHRLARRLLALRQFEALMRLRRVPRLLAAPALNEDRCIMLLRTLDALAVNGNARGVARALFGETAVAKDWDHESDYLRMRTRRLVSASQRLAAGAYRNFVSGKG